MRSPEGGEWLVTDVNPRIGAGTAISVAAGVDLTAAWAADVCGDHASTQPAALSRERFVVRQYLEVVTA
jgi:hypothetical protein